jgi:hypothetical protein
VSHVSIRLTWLALHLLLIFGISCRDTFGVMSRGYTILPAALNPIWKRAESITSTLFGLRLSGSGPVSDAVRAYRHSAGIESGYGFFAPNVPDSYRIVFEMQRRDGQMEYESIDADRWESGIRVSSFLDEVGQTHSNPLRQIMVQLLTHAVWQRHPDVTHIRTNLLTVALPTVREFQNGKTEPSSEFLYAYDFSLKDDEP